VNHRILRGLLAVIGLTTSEDEECPVVQDKVSLGTHARAGRPDGQSRVVADRRLQAERRQIPEARIGDGDKLNLTDALRLVSDAGHHSIGHVIEMVTVQEPLARVGGIECKRDAARRGYPHRITHCT
jgi:hypothetical protein